MDRSTERLLRISEALNGRIMGGVGLSIITEDEVMPHHGLEQDFELQLSSTSAMLGDPERAMNTEEEIVVTLRTPFWATVNFDVSQLEDPDNIYSEPESLHTLGRLVRRKPRYCRTNVRVLERVTAIDATCPVIE